MRSCGLVSLLVSPPLACIPALQPASFNIQSCSVVFGRAKLDATGVCSGLMNSRPKSMSAIERPQEVCNIPDGWPILQRTESCSLTLDACWVWVL
jgi:hypothetical protein